MPYVLNGMRPQTEDALLHGQLQESLRPQLMKALAESGATDYICITVSGG